MVTSGPAFPADRERLALAIKEGETRSSAELVLVVADSCGSYGVFAFLWPALSALLIGGVVAVVLPQFAAPRLFLIEAGLFALLAVALQWRPALLRLVPQQIRPAQAQQVAAHQFALRVEGRTPNRTGLLLFLALAERQVFILPDTGVSVVIERTAWIGIVERLVAATRKGPPVEALAGAVGQVLGVLEEHFPKRENGSTSLSDEVVELSAGSAGRNAES